MIVCKFGGTSVQDAAAIRRLITIIRSRLPERPVLVVSALARITDGLIELTRMVELGGTAYGEHLDAMMSRHAGTAAELDGSDRALQAIQEEADSLRAELDAAAGRRLTPRERDAVAARGELWSSRLIAAALEGAGIPARWLDVRDVMITDDRYGRATPYTQVLNTRARDRFIPLLESGAVPVTQGFIGATADGVTTTFGRGGSDFTASLIGAALHAARVEIWTDVDGLMTADPRIVASARTLAVASYEEAAELATFGARVLHPATAVPLVREGIPIVVLNSQRPEQTGTTIESSAELERGFTHPLDFLETGHHRGQHPGAPDAGSVRLPPPALRDLRTPRGGGGCPRQQRGERLADDRRPAAPRPRPARAGGPR